MKLSHLCDRYHVALAYSNIQGKFRLPAVVSGIITDEDDIDELEKRRLPSKKLLVRRKDSLYNLQTTFDDVSEYLTEYETDRVTITQNLQRDIESSYLKLLAILRKSHLRVITGKIESVSIRCLEDPMTWDSVNFSDNFLRQINMYSPNIKICDKTSHDRLLEIARILATLEFQRLRSVKEEFITIVIVREKQHLFQILKFAWHSPPIDEYSNYDVGAPAIVVRKPESPYLDFVYIRPKMKLSITPIAKFCRGSQEGKQIAACRKHTGFNPFGQHLLGSSSEQCWGCRKGHEYSLCIYRKPLCNGYDILCGRPDFAGNFCCGLFALYVTRFTDELKVGTAFLPNVVGRLLEQGANSALVIHPVNGVMNAYVMEKSVKQYLQERIDLFSPFGIKRVFRRAPPSEKKLSDFLLEWSRNDKPIMEKIGEVVAGMTLKMGNLGVSLAQSERNVCSFLRNYLMPPRKLYKEYEKPRPLFHSANGFVVGIRGSFLFLSSGDILDLKELQGYVVKGGV